MVRKMLNSVAFLAMVMSASQHSSAQEHPNILLILADDVGCETIGAYGGERWATPNIDALANDGMSFEYCFSMPVCHPSRICLLTGQYPFRLKSAWGTFPRSMEFNTLSRVLQSAGYCTAVAGKWQLGLLGKDLQQPARMGFEQWCTFGWHEGARYHDPMIYENGRLREDTAGGYGPDLYVDFLAQFMEQSRDVGKPFFAFYSMALCHDVTNDLPVQVPYPPEMDRWMNYGEMVESMDQMIGRMLVHLDRLRLRDNTIVVFTADNGTSVRSKLRHKPDGGYEMEQVFSIRHGQRVDGGKGTLLNTGTNVPLIVRWPGTVKPGTTSAALVDFSDFLPTFSGVSGASVGWKHDGISFLPSLRDPSISSRTAAFCEDAKGPAWVRTQTHKLYSDGRFLDVHDDVTERSPLRSIPVSAVQTHQLLSEFLASLNYRPANEQR